LVHHRFRHVNWRIGYADKQGLLPQVIVEYADVTAAMAGRQSMHGRRFAGRTVVATFLPEHAYGAGQF
jgi:hypothetical protein